jgi:hypothetical protein
MILAWLVRASSKADIECRRTPERAATSLFLTTTRWDHVDASTNSRAAATAPAVLCASRRKSCLFYHAREA